jgi:ABC-type sugar transport system substrate-binding protein
VKPALVLKAAEVAQDPEDQGVAVVDQGKAVAQGKAEEDDAFR